MIYSRKYIFGVWSLLWQSYWDPWNSHAKRDFWSLLLCNEMTFGPHLRMDAAARRPDLVIEGLEPVPLPYFQGGERGWWLNQSPMAIWFNQPWLYKKKLNKTPKRQDLESFKLVNTGRFGEHGVAGEWHRNFTPSPIHCPVRLIHLAVSVISFYNTLVI